MFQNNWSQVWAYRTLSAFKCNQELLHRDDAVMDRIRNRKLQLSGHICRMPDDRLLGLKTLVLETVEGSDDHDDPHGERLMIFWCAIMI